ncbi:FAD-dependent monooxygenase [Aestuariibacter salexigens]|uniref:FAD-dependent monooxygenase n=1 Tax=Aestuariibacter salexigens TaxID=226010 RepID=UPI0003FDC795|nr:FAD-dependent monooxygenase [Aestuariibacter salexigens]
MRSVDVVIVGGGMVGLLLARALHAAPLSIAIIDADDGSRPLTETPERRVSAVSVASQRMLQRLDVWSEITSQRLAEYTHMHVWEQDSFASIDFDAADVHQQALGHIIENQAIRRALWEKVSKQSNAEIIAERLQKIAVGSREAFITLADGSALSARLLVGADGANSIVRQQTGLPFTFWDYDHQAIVTTVRTERPHAHTARQVFTPYGPLAFLPLYDEHLCSIVWSQQTAQAQRLMSLDEKAFSHELSVAFDMQLGVCEVIDERFSYPLSMRYARQWVSNRVALIGDAVHTIHPLAGQGANLGLLDAAALAQTLHALAERDEDIGDAELLRPFERWRKTEAVKLIAAMEGFKRLFSNHDPVLKLVRGLGLSGVDKLPFVKQSFIQQAMGLSGELPVLARAGGSESQFPE